jgi:hypothetical protein
MRPILWKDSANREQRNKKNESFCVFFAEMPPMLSKDSANREQRNKKNESFCVFFSCMKHREKKKLVSAEKKCENVVPKTQKI